MIAIASITNNLAGDLIIHELPESDFDTAETRVTRTATLDLGTVVDIQGYAVGDRTLNVASVLTEAEAGKLYDIFKNGVLLNVAIPEGCFRGVISRITLDKGNVSFQVFITERLSA